MNVPLPTEKLSPSLTVENANTFIYGPPGIGKTTFLSEVDPEHTLILATEPGYKGIEAFIQPINSWVEYAKTVEELKKGDHPFTTFGVDTVDMLATQCQRYVMAREKVSHPSDLEWGKGWELLSEEWRNRLAPLMNLGGVIFIGHSEMTEIKKPMAPAITAEVPRLGPKSLRGFIEDTAEFIFYATFEHGESGTNRILRTQPGEGWIAKSRIPVPDPLPLNGKIARFEMEMAIAEYRKDVQPA